MPDALLNSSEARLLPPTSEAHSHVGTAVGTASEPQKPCRNRCRNRVGTASEPRRNHVGTGWTVPPTTT